MRTSQTEPWRRPARVNVQPASEQTDLGLLQNGDDLALDRLIARWERPLFAFAWRYLQDSGDARDVVAEVFVRLYRQRRHLRPDTNLPAWLFTALSNLCHNQYRWRRRHPTVSLDVAGDKELAGAGTRDLPLDVPAATTVDDYVERDEARMALAEAIDRLAHELKAAVLLHHYDGLSYREIAAITGCSERGVETRLYRARQQLRRELAAQFHELASQ